MRKPECGPIEWVTIRQSPTCYVSCGFLKPSGFEKSWQRSPFPRLQTITAHARTHTHLHDDSVGNVDLKLVLMASHNEPFCNYSNNMSCILQTDWIRTYSSHDAKQRHVD